MSEEAPKKRKRTHLLELRLTVLSAFSLGEVQSALQAENVTINVGASCAGRIVGGSVKKA